jgi:tetratricopeptide (TPR) repeat protein
MDPAVGKIRKNLSGMLADWAALREQAGETDQAERLLREATTHDPTNGMAFVRLGDLAYFRRSRFAEAIGYWKQAYGKIPSEEWPGVAERISQAQRDQAIERGFVSAKTAHFDIRIQEHHVNVDALGPMLEEAHARLTQALGFGPSTITVIVYTARDLQRTYNQRDWAMGFYDGRLRMLWDEIGAAMAKPLIAHELTHAFLHEAYGPALPIWVHEGLAQYEEGLRPASESEIRAEEGVLAGTQWIPLKWLDRRFRQPADRDDVLRAYVQARLVVGALVSRHGMDRFKQFLDALSRGTLIEAAYNAAFAPAQWSHTDRPIF